MDDGYREDAGRFAKLEGRISGLEQTKFYEMIKIGANIAAVLVGCAVVVGSVALGDERRAYGAAAQIEAETAQAEAQSALQLADLDIREAAREECAVACEGQGMTIENARLDRNDNGDWKVVSCSCGSSRGHRMLWNDLITQDDVLRGQCRSSCENAGLGLSRAVLRTRQIPDVRPPENDEYGRPIPREPVYVRELAACSCVDEHRSRTLWDDRVAHSTECMLQMVDGAATCHTERRAVEAPTTPATTSSMSP